MTLSHVTAMYFGGKTEAAKKRLQSLKAAGYVRQRPRRLYEPSVLFMGRAAFGVLLDIGLLANYPRLTPALFEKRARVGELYLQHELLVQDVRVALCLEISKSDGLHVAEFSTWPLLFQFMATRAVFKPGEGTEVLVKPDAYIRVCCCDSGGSASEHFFYLEIDRSTETLDVLAHRSVCYRDFYKRGGLALRNGRPRSDFEKYPFRVLMVFKTAERRNNVAESLLMLPQPIRTQVWMTTLSEVTRDPLGPIWMLPADYDNAVRNTVFRLKRARRAHGYVRDTQREQTIDRSVEKRKLFDAISDSTQNL